MHLIDNEMFLSQVARQGIGLDVRYAEPRTLGYQNDWWLAVPMPGDVGQRRVAIATALDLFASDVPVWVWRRGGKWLWFGDHLAVEGADAIFSLAGVEGGASGTLRSNGGEKGLLFELIFMNSLIARWVGDDLFVVPDGHEFVLYFDHDGQIILECRDERVYDSVGEKLLNGLRKHGIPVE